MNRLAPTGLVLLAAVSGAAQFVPPVPIGIKSDAKIRAPRALEFPSEKLQWIRVRSPHFDVISSASAERTQAIVSDLEQMTAVLKQTSARFRSSPVATTIFVFSDRNETDAWFDLLLGVGSRRLGGAYVRHASGGTMIIDGANARRVERTAMHELVHDLLRQDELVPPLWIEEGLAEYFSGARVEEHHVEAGFSVPHHAALLRERKLMALATMFAVEPETDAAVTPLFYAQSWAAVDWLMQLDQTAFYAFLQDLERGAPVADALSKRYGKTLADLESAIRRRGRVGGSTVRFPSEGLVAIAPPASLDRATLLFELGRFLSVIPGAERDAARHYAEALRIDPHHARTLAALGRYDEAIAAAPDDANVLLESAESLLSTAIGPFAGVFEPKDSDRERFRKARTLASHAREIVPPNTAAEGRALGALGVSYLVESDVAPGIAHLEHAVTLLPRRNDLALNLYAMLLQHDRGKADALFASTFAKTRDRQLAFAARNVLLNADVNRANDLARAGKLGEAATLIRELAAATDDVKARHDLETQAAQLDRTAAVNRHITMYNQAIVFANSNHNADAIKILDAILKEATDPFVIADAKRLRAELRKAR